MGNTCSPDAGAERQVKDTDVKDVRAAEAASKGDGDLESKDPKQLFEILNSYIAQNEKLVEENKELKGTKADVDENQKLLEELEKLRALTKTQEEELAGKDAKIEERDIKIKAEEERIATLKLQRELKEKEAAMLSPAETHSTVLIDGDLLKFTKGGKGKPSYKSVSITQRLGGANHLQTQAKKDAPEELPNIVPVGWTSGSLVLNWSDDENSQTLSRAMIVELIDGAAAVGDKEFETRTFSIKTAPNGKVIAFAAKDAEEKERWFQAISSAMDGISAETTGMNTEFELEHTFVARPLGFRVEEQILKAVDGSSKAVLMVTKVEQAALQKILPPGLVVTRCGELAFDGLEYTKKLEAIKGSECPFVLGFKGYNFLRAADAASKPKTVRAAHARDVSMQVLYPELFAELTKDGSESREALLKMPVVQDNPELKAMLESSDFALLRELMSDPEKLRAFMNKDL